MDYLKDGEFILQECKNCGLIFQKQILNDLLMHKLYEGWIDPGIDFNSFRGMDNKDYYSSIAGELSAMISYLKDPSGELSFFDFGTGWGKWCQIARSLGCNSFGLELSSAKKDYLKGSGIDLIEYNKIPEYKFDIINAQEVMEHIQDPLEAIKHLRSALKPEGVLRICVPDGFDIKRRLSVLDWKAPRGTKNSLNPVAPLEHINCFNHNNLIKMAEMLGFRSVKIPIRYQYSYAIKCGSVRQLIRSLALPLRRNIFNQGTIIFFSKKP